MVIGTVNMEIVHIKNTQGTRPRNISLLSLISITGELGDEKGEGNGVKGEKNVKGSIGKGRKVWSGEGSVRRRDIGSVNMEIVHIKTPRELDLGLLVCYH